MIRNDTLNMILSFVTHDVSNMILTNALRLRYFALFYFSFSSSIWNDLRLFILLVVC
jgi:hypothetical protein